jgi:hypothetical protein
VLDQRYGWSSTRVLFLFFEWLLVGDENGFAT